MADRKGRKMRHTSARAILATVSTLLIVGAPQTARAVTHDRGTFDDGFQHSVDTETCAVYGFDLDVIEHEFGMFVFTSDDEGNFLRGSAHVRYDAWISANGETLVESDVWNATFQPDGSKSVRGLTVHIAGPGGGIVQPDAGRLVYDQDGNLVRVNGPHPQLSGESFCPALVV
jgi:hypothetical protein